MTPQHRRSSSSTDVVTTATATALDATATPGGAAAVPPTTAAAVRVGFLGCGTIACAIARGMAAQAAVTVESISVSLRSESKSKQLRGELPHLVSIHADNQEIVDRSDLVFICVLPHVASEVLKGVTLDGSKHCLISLVSTAKIEDLIRDSALPPSRVSKLICLPSIARHEGVALHCAPHTDDDGGGSSSSARVLTELLKAMGGVVSCETEEQLQACMMSTCLMGPIYGMMRSNQEWLAERGGLSKRDASYLVIKQYKGMIQDAVDRMEQHGDDCGDLLDELIEEQTPGGLNEQALRNLEQLGALDANEKVMDAILSRIKGESDGSL